MASECDCGPPPDFLIPPPPSPEFLWDLDIWAGLEDNLCADSALHGLCVHQLIYIQPDNGHNNLLAVHPVNVVPDSQFVPRWALLLLAFIGALVLAVLVVLLICKRRASTVQSGSTHGLCKVQSTASNMDDRTIRSHGQHIAKGTNNTQWAYNNCTIRYPAYNGMLSNNAASVGTLMYGVSSRAPSNVNIVQYHSNTQPRPVIDTQTVYDEIIQPQAHNYNTNVVRHPAPLQPPPPPPTTNHNNNTTPVYVTHPTLPVSRGGSANVSCSSAGSLDHELSALQQDSPSPYRLNGHSPPTNGDSPPNMMGRESGYGTAHRSMKHHVKHSHTSPQLNNAHRKLVVSRASPRLSNKDFIVDKRQLRPLLRDHSMTYV